MASPPLESVEIRPGVGMLALLSSMNYKPWYALSELVDNSLASFLANRKRLAKKPHRQDFVTVRITFDRGAGEIEVVDDAGGIAASDVARAFRPAEPPPDTTGLAQFGIGMKSAACWYSSHFVVTSTALGESVRRSVTFDVPKIVDGQIEELPIEVEEAAVETHGTTLTMSRLHRPIPAGTTLGKVRQYLASIYRHYLREGILVLEVGEREVHYEEPEILRSRRWDAGKGDRPKKWRKDVEITLPSGRKVSGWAALRAKGSTSEAGLALLFRGKVVVGAGGPAGDVEDLFRPQEIFGAPNSFVSQRLFGELDVSAMKVAHSKDAILWDGEEEAFLKALKRALDKGSKPLIKMALKHRVTERGPAVDKELSRAVEATVAAAGESGSNGADPKKEDRPPAPEDSISAKFKLPVSGSDVEVLFAVIVGSGRTWVRIRDAEGGHTIEVDRNHPFMQSFAHLPGQEVEPVLRLAAALGIAEIEARQAGVADAGTVRGKLNQLLQGPLAYTTMSEMEEVAK
ncbi:MAG TPA: ATP-binding protein [Solirubrobacterales bacterium]|nr:ATP-binding protein [Solirubrobacterales bacterium]